MSSGKPLILYVDDEAQALKYFKLAFQKDYEVLTAGSVTEAWGLVTLRPELDLVISDQRMPGGSGVELLTRVRERNPGIMRLLTTAYAELESAVKAVNEGAVYAYVHKPWKIDDLKVVLARALDYRRLQQERDMLVQEKLAVVQDLLLVDGLRCQSLLARLLGRRLRGSGAAFAAFWKQSAPLRLRRSQDLRAGAYWGLLLDDTRQALALADAASVLTQPAAPNAPGLRGAPHVVGDPLALGLLQLCLDGLAGGMATAPVARDGRSAWDLPVTPTQPGLLHRLVLAWMTATDHGGSVELIPGDTPRLRLELPAQRAESVTDSQDQAWILHALAAQEP